MLPLLLVGYQSSHGFFSWMMFLHCFFPHLFLVEDLCGPAAHVGNTKADYDTGIQGSQKNITIYM